MNNEPELSSEARRLIAEARGADDPTDDDRNRVKARWLATVAAAAGVSALGEAARAASTTGWGLKAAGALLVAAAGSIGLYTLLPDETTPPAPVALRSERATEEIAALPRTAPPIAAVPVAAPAQPAEVPVAPPVAEPADVHPRAEAAPVVAAAAEAEKPAVSVRRPRPAPRATSIQPAASPSEAEAPAPEPVVDVVPQPALVDPALQAPVAAEAPPTEPAAPAEEAASAASRQLGEEAAMLSEIRGSLKAGTPQRALVLLSEYRQRFAAPMLEMEAAALRVDALCRSGDVERGRAEAERFQTTWPSSPLVRRVRAACP